MFKKKWFWLVVVPVVAILGVGAYLLVFSESEKIAFRYDKVDRGEVAVTISATGTLSAVTTVQVGSQVSGTIAKLYADFNSSVTQGQLLAQLDPTFLQASVNEQQASLERATAQLNEAQRNHNRMTDLFGKALVSQVELDAAKTSLETTRASLRSAEAALQRAEVNLRYATVRAPISGTVISRNVDVGQTVAASLSAPTLFTIANDLRKMQLQASVDEADIGNVKEGQNVKFRVDAYPEEEFDGEVSQIRLAPVVTQNVVTYTVIISVANPKQKLMPGMTATVTIEVARSEDVLRVPVQAVRFTPPESVRELIQKRAEAQKDTSTQGGPEGSRGGGGQGWEGRPGGEGGPGGMGGQDMTPEERAKMMERFRKMRARSDRATVWVMSDGLPKSVRIVKGIQNAQYVEIVRGPLKEGDEVIIGALGAKPTAGQQTKSPFQPSGMPSGGGGRRGGM